MTRIRPNQIHVHYNGWGSRWDEWLDNDSPRIAVFRTYTVQNPKSLYLSPYPNVVPEHREIAQDLSLSSVLKDTTQLL